MKFFESEHYFEYPWDQVTAANWQKYPNEMSTHVISVDILSREINANILRSERLIGCKQSIPSWLSFLVGGASISYVREVSEVDLEHKTLVMKSSNLTMNNLLLVNETVVYRPDPELPQSRTLFAQSAEITAFASIGRICDKIEEWSVERFGQNAKNGKMAFENVLKTLHEKWELNGVFENTSVLNEVSKLQFLKNTQ
ncbi:Protein UPS2 mitochondrial [Spathaspora sp. JA1]|nr:Protein UPS2 mitochondrial [Spathaspora sp. JA1]